MRQKPPWLTKVLISLIMNRYAAGSPSREDFTDWMHLFSRSTARDEWRDREENKDISNWEATEVEEKVDGLYLYIYFKGFASRNSYDLIANYS